MEQFIVTRVMRLKERRRKKAKKCLFKQYKATVYKAHLTSCDNSTTSNTRTFQIRIENGQNVSIFEIANSQIQICEIRRDECSFHRELIGNVINGVAFATINLVEGSAPRVVVCFPET